MSHAQMVATGPNPATAGRRAWIGLAVLVLPTLLLSVDIGVLYLALPHLAADLGANSTQQLWILDIYSFVLAGFLVTMGTLGDRIGRRKLLLIGGACFGLASIVAAFSTSAPMLIASRAALGVAGATLMPSTMALIRNMFPDPRAMGTALGVWMTCFLGGLAIGPLVGGIMLEQFWWGSAFLLGVPFMVLLLITGPFFLPEYRDTSAGRLDLTSVGLSLAAILPAIYGLKELARDGLGPIPLAAIVVGSAVAIVFVMRQTRLADPLLDLRLLRQRAFSAALATNLVLGIVMAGASFVGTLYLQMVAGLSPIVAGLWLVPQNVAMAIGFLAAPRLAERFGTTRVVTSGLGVAGLGLLVMSRVPSADGQAWVVGAFVVTAAGIAPAMALMIGLVLGSAPPEKAGSAASLNETSGEFGIALGIASLGTLASFVYRSVLAIPASVPEDAADAAREGIATALVAASQMPTPTGAELVEAARTAFTAGLNGVGLIGGIVFLGLACVTALTFRPAAQEHPAPPIDATGETATAPSMAA
jgi:DHA2 family multidrug resistance protein-like MFS transporter